MNSMPRVVKTRGLSAIGKCCLPCVFVHALCMCAYHACLYMQCACVAYHACLYMHCACVAYHACLYMHCACVPTMRVCTCIVHVLPTMRVCTCIVHVCLPCVFVHALCMCAYHACLYMHCACVAYHTCLYMHCACAPTLRVCTCIVLCVYKELRLLLTYKYMHTHQLAMAFFQQCSAHTHT